jgi:phosphoglycerol transferase MdoB-like AlkP superfamily enzyme
MGMTLLAATRPTEWDFPLFLHVLGAMVLVGGLLTAVGMEVYAWRRREPGELVAYSRGGFWALLTVALPGWVLMRVGAEWIRSKEGWTGDNDPTWLGIGYLTADFGFVVLLVTILLAGFGVRRARRPGATANVLGRIATPLATILLVLYLVAVWAMTAKPD